MTQSKALYAFLFGQVSVPGIPANNAILLLRIFAGYTIMMAGLDKLPLPGWMTDQVASMGIPIPTQVSWIASFGEFAFFGSLLCGTAEGGTETAVTNIRAYIPRPGLYRFDFNVQTHVYSLDTLATL
jgi:hypothetical protein